MTASILHIDFYVWTPDLKRIRTCSQQYSVSTVSDQRVRFVHDGGEQMVVALERVQSPNSIAPTLSFRFFLPTPTASRDAQVIARSLTTLADSTEAKG